MIRAAPKHLVDCSPLDTTLFQAANPDAALPGASWLRDLRNLRKTQYADLGNPPTESERHQIQMFCQHLFPPHPVRIPVSFATRVNVGSPRPRDSSGTCSPTIRFTSKHTRNVSRFTSHAQRTRIFFS